MRHLIELIENVNINNVIGDFDLQIESIEYDSRKCKKNSLFVAVEGTFDDGHKFIDSAIEKGSNVIVCRVLPSALKENVTYLQVDNTRRTLAEIAQFWFDYPSKSIDVIGVTGTNGKTTLTFLLNDIFKAAGKKTAILGTTGIYFDENKIEATHTTPESLELYEIFNELRSSEIDTVFMEVSSHALSQGRASGINFKGALFTNLSHEHLDYHNTMEEYAAAKKILFNYLTDDSIALVNADSEYAEYMLNEIEPKAKKTVGRFNSDYVISNESISLTHNKFELNGIEIITPLIGRFNIENAAMSAAFALECGIDSNTVVKALSKSKGAPGRMERIPLRNGAVGIVDYAHTPDALEKALTACKDVLTQSDQFGKLISVFGCGGDRDRTKRPIMGNISSNIADYSIVTDDNPRTEDPSIIAEEIIMGIKKDNFELIHGRREAINKAFNISNKNDLILIAGKGHEKYQIIGTTKHHFDDVEEISKFK